MGVRLSGTYGSSPVYTDQGKKTSKSILKPKAQTKTASATATNPKHTDKPKPSDTNNAASKTSKGGLLKPRDVTTYGIGVGIGVGVGIYAGVDVQFVADSNGDKGIAITGTIGGGVGVDKVSGIAPPTPGPVVSKTSGTVDDRKGGTANVGLSVGIGGEVSFPTNSKKGGGVSVSGGIGGHGTVSGTIVIK